MADTTRTSPENEHRAHESARIPPRPCRPLLSRRGNCPSSRYTTIDHRGWQPTTNPLTPPCPRQAVPAVSKKPGSRCGSDGDSVASRGTRCSRESVRLPRPAGAPVQGPRRSLPQPTPRRGLAIFVQPTLTQRSLGGDSGREVVGYTRAAYARRSCRRRDHCRVLGRARGRQRDHGSQHHAIAYRSALRRLGIHQSTSRTGSCLDGAAAEAFFATIKVEIGTNAWPGRAAACRAIEIWIKLYNERRLHALLGYCTPLEARLTWQDRMSTAV